MRKKIRRMIKSKIKRAILKFDWETYLSKKFDIKFSKTGYYICCPFCHHVTSKQPDTKFHLGISPATKNKYHCYRCSSSGDIIDFVSKIDKKPKKEVVHWLIRQSKLHPTEKNIKKEVEDDSINYISLPSLYIPIESNELPKMVKKYIKKRRLTIDQCKQYDIGYCTLGNYCHRLIVPIRFNNRVATFIARDMTGIAEKPKMYPYDSPVSQILFNWDIAKTKDFIVICEGVFDAIRVGERAVALLGSSMSDEQLDLISSRPFKKIYICLDYDALKKSKKILSRLFTFFDAYITHLPQDKDPADHTRQEIWDTIYNKSYDTLRLI